jgi:asparagine synthase (glutamine-hydrolysing)
VCGIVAILRLGDRPLVEAKRTVAKMLRAIAHRGPDDAGVFVDEHCALGAVRLAVVDAHGGKQPAFGCEESGVSCVYNGELYDFAALRSSLIARGHRVEDRCDTSLLPHLYEAADGDVVKMVEQMHGMFAFALWDARRRQLVLGRDRFGIKPLFYAVGNRDCARFLVVASEAKAIFASGLVDAELDRDSVEDLFTLGYPCPPRSMFRGVRSLAPGHFATIALIDATLAGIARTDVAAPMREPPMSVQRYWRAPIPHAGKHDSRPLRAVAGDLRDALAGAVNSHLAADVAVASSLSGGLDSSLIASLASTCAQPARSATFSLTFPDDASYDESRSIDDVTRSLAVDVHSVTMTSSAASLLSSMVWHSELPLYAPGAIGGLLLAQSMRSHGVAVALTGDGADELFGGYDVFRLAKARRTLGSAFSRSAASIVAKPKGIAKLFRKNKDVDVTVEKFGMDPPWFEQWRLVASANVLRSSRGVDEPPREWASLVRDDIAELDPLDQQIAIELETRLPSWILVISDRSHMAHGVEARVPYLDDDVAALALAIAPAHKMRLLREKAVLREAARGLVPERIRRRRKQPFLTPVAPWFDFADDAMSESALDKTGMFDADAVFAVRRELASSQANSVERLRAELVLMLVLQTQLLARAFVERSPPQPLFPSTHAALELLESTS